MKCVFDHCVWTLSNKQYTYSIQKWNDNKAIESYQYGFEYYCNDVAVMNQCAHMECCNTQ